MIWRPENERAGGGIRALPAGLGSRGGARVPVRARAGRGVPHQAVAQAARVARPRGREGRRPGRAARRRSGRAGGGAQRPRCDRAAAGRSERPAAPRHGGGREEGGLAGVVRRRVGVTGVGRRLFLWFSARLFGGLRAALNEVFDTDERRSWPVTKLLDLAMVLCTGTLLVLGALVATWEARNAGSVGRSFAIDWLWRFSLELTSFALGVALFFVVFKFLPSRRIVWRTALVAAVFCSLGFEVAKRLYALYVTRFATLDRVASDANIVALFLFLLWVYYTAYLFLLGGEVAEMYDLVRMRRSQRVQLG